MGSQLTGPARLLCNPMFAYISKCYWHRASTAESLVKWSSISPKFRPTFDFMSGDVQYWGGQTILHLLKISVNILVWYVLGAWASLARAIENFHKQNGGWLENSIDALAILEWAEGDEKRHRKRGKGENGLREERRKAPSIASCDNWPLTIPLARRKWSECLTQNYFNYWNLLKEISMNADMQGRIHTPATSPIASVGIAKCCGFPITFVYNRNKWNLMNFSRSFGRTR